VKKKLTQKQLEIIIALVFSLLILVLSNLELVYIEIGHNRFLDLAAIPAVFAFMIGGPFIGVPVAVAWGFIVYFQIPIDTKFSLVSVLIIKVIFALSCWHIYQWTKRIFPGSPHNVYWGIIGGEIVRWTASTVIISSSTHTNRFVDSVTYIGFALETIFCLIAMFMIVEKLRQVHILNGIRRKAKARQK